MEYIILLPFIIPIGIMDYKERIIKNKLCICIAAIGLLEGFFPNQLGIEISMTERIVAGAILFTILFSIYIKNEKLSGGGDIKLLAALGLALGFKSLVPILVIASITSIIYCKIANEKYVPLGFHIMMAFIIIVARTVIGMVI